MAMKSKKSAPAATEGRTAPKVAAPAKQAATLSPSLNHEAFAGLEHHHAAALFQSNLALFNGFEAIGKELIDLAGTTVESANRAAEALLGAKTMEDMVGLNAELIRTHLEDLLLRSVRLSEMSVAMTKEAWAPFGWNVDAVFAALTKSRAA